MRHLFKTACFAVLAAALLTSCKDCDTTVTQVDLEDAAWLVYERGDTVKFLNEEGDTAQFINSALRAEQVPGEGFDISDNCISHFDVQAYSVMENSDGKYPALATYFLKRQDNLTVSIALLYLGEYLLDLDEPDYETVEINDNNYFDVYEVVLTDETKATNPKRILFNKAHGFLSVEFFNEKKLEILP